MTTDVGGNGEVVSRPELGMLIPFDEYDALYQALRVALTRPWDRVAITAHACDNEWEAKVRVLVDEFTAIASNVASSRVTGKYLGPI